MVKSKPLDRKCFLPAKRDMGFIGLNPVYSERSNDPNELAWPQALS